jgi:hypothetical protein
MFFFYFFPSSGILKKTEERNVSETGCFHPQVREGEAPILLDLLERSNPNQRTTDLVSKTLCSSVFFRIPDKGRGPEAH